MLLLLLLLLTLLRIHQLAGSQAGHARYLLSTTPKPADSDLPAPNPTSVCAPGAQTISSRCMWEFGEA